MRFRRFTAVRVALWWLVTLSFPGLLALWVASGWSRLGLWETRRLLVYVYAGELDVYYAFDRPQHVLELFMDVRMYPEHARAPADRPFRVQWDLPRIRGLRFTRGVRAHIPLWTLFLLSAAVAICFWSRAPRVRRGYCASCGYNLRGLREPRCPECGTAFAPTKWAGRG
jgi:hypothetical protein